MLEITEFINSTLGSELFLLVVQVCAFVAKLYLLGALIIYSLGSSMSKTLFILLGVFVGAALLIDAGWIMILVRNIFLLKGEESRIITFIARFGWAFFITQHQSLCLFLEYLFLKKVYFKKQHILFSLVNITISCGFLYLAFVKFTTPSYSKETLLYEIQLIKIACITSFTLSTPTFYIALKEIYSKQLPKILLSQLKIFIAFLVIPHLFLECITNAIPFLLSFAPRLALNKHFFLSLSTVLCTSVIYYCCRRIMGLRFLNVKRQVELPNKFNFIKDFKDILEQLSYVTALKELTHLTQSFFKTAFVIPPNKTRLYIRNLFNDSSSSPTQDVIINKIESFIKYEDNLNSITSLLKENKIVIRDEIEFTNFYEETPERIALLTFLKDINADIFLPIYERQVLSGYIIVEHNARPRQLFNSTERDEMVVFASYVSNVINILKHSNLELLLLSEKDLKEELYHKHQEVNQYKESMHSFLRTHNERKIGIVFYKARRFIIANESAQELIGIDINTNQGHPLAQAFKQIAHKVHEYKTTHTCVTRDTHGNKLMLSGICSLEPHNVIITVYYPEISDIVSSQFSKLKDPSRWDYLLYLETTTSGKLINQLIPGTSETLLSFKIDLLTTALSKKATLLEIAEDDVLPTVEIIHHISLRPTLHVLKLTVPEKHDEVGIALFGINALFNAHNSAEPLLHKLDSVGTLFIQNVHLLSIETQHYLAEFITYGFYRKLRSDHKFFSNVRIICSTSKNIHNLVMENLFSKTLFNELKKTCLNMPSLSALSEPDMAELTQGFTEQVLKTHTFKNLLELNEKDKNKLLDERPLSIYELKSKIQQVLIQKSTRHNIYDETNFDPAYHITDPELAKAIRLGKKALKDPHIMALLWDKFKNQNKIATLLGVNRSSVNRRCQEYKLYEK